jgi:hypothetical protein
MLHIPADIMAQYAAVLAQRFVPPSQRAASAAAAQTGSFAFTQSRSRAAVGLQAIVGRQFGLDLVERSPNCTLQHLQLPSLTKTFRILHPPVGV